MAPALSVRTAEFDDESMSMRNTLIVMLSLWLWSAGALAASSLDELLGGSEPCTPITRFGVITDVHHTNRPDRTRRKYSSALDKMQSFVEVMNAAEADFVIELGDFVDALDAGQDPVSNLIEIEAAFSRFEGPIYHVLGNHEFDGIDRETFLHTITNTGLPPGFSYYSFDRRGIHYVVLDADYSVAEPHRPFDRQDPADPFWNWKDAWIPQEQLDWLVADLSNSNLPTVVFSHQVLHRNNDKEHTVKNADAVRAVLEQDGQVIAVFSGHDHRGEIAVRRGIHYFVLEGNVGLNLDWSVVSPTLGLDPAEDSPFALVEIGEQRSENFNGMKSYCLRIQGNAQQYSYADQVQILAP